MDTKLNLLTHKSTQQTVYGIDASSANKEKRTGVENYCRSLIEHMKVHALGEDERVVLYSNTKLDQTLRTLPKGWSSTVLNWPFARGWMALRMSWEMLRRPPTILFVPGQSLPHTPPLSKGGPGGVAVSSVEGGPGGVAVSSVDGGLAFVTTVHDLAFARRPDLYKPTTRIQLKRATKRAVKKATRIIVPSQATKQDLVDLYRVDVSRIVVIPEAADTNLFRRYTQEEARPVLQKYRLGTNFFLVVGRLEKKKNITNLIRAFEHFKNRRGVGDPFELVCVGEPGYGYDEISKYFELSSHKEQIRQLGYVQDEELAPLMSQAIACLFPSWYEGFGIPNLEAMAVGTALVTSDIPAHREVVGEALRHAQGLAAGLLVPPGEPDAWARAMEKIVEDSALRSELITKGTQRVRQFSWQKTAEQTWEILRAFR